MEKVEKSMDGFKLLAIRPLKGCNPDYLKILKPDVFYTFYNNYTFKVNPESGRIIVEFLPVKKGLYDVPGNDKNLSINVSAIVGQNGSGKSSLLELYYLCMYFIAINRDRPFLKPNLISIALEMELTDEKDPKSKSKFQYLVNQKAEIEKILETFKIQLFYSVDDNIYLYDTSRPKIDDLEYDFVELIKGGLKEKREFLLSSLFENDSPYDPTGFAYSCVVNYSVFGLNTSEMGQWITTLFHKNDAYRTPIVINPMRTNGDFVIDDENELLTGRIFQSLVLCLKRNDNNNIGTLLGTQRAPEKIIFRLKKSVGIGGLTLRMDGSRELLFSDKSIYEFGETNFILFKKYISNILKIDIDNIIDGNLLFRYCLEYAYSKSGRIFDKYPVFREERKGEEYFKLLIDDRSHITLKFRQAINFITGDLFSKLKNAIFNDKKPNIDLIEITVSDYDKEVEYSISEIKTEFEEISDEISFVPPPIFEIDFVFSENPNDKINLLSSGESQSTHSLNAIYYHLRNIDSMNREQLDFDYEYVNLILDEVELYHHPEIQRTYLYRLLEGIKALKLKKIKGINIIFATHSPFILSDIPSNNILRLKEGNPVSDHTQTFGANIHQLLHNDFFLENGFIGEFAKSKIEEVVDFLRLKKWNNDEDKINARIASEVNDILKNDLKIQLEILKLQKSRTIKVNESLDLDICKEIIDLIGEPLICNSLNQLLSEVENPNSTDL
jgi:predicted ATPase